MGEHLAVSNQRSAFSLWRRLCGWLTSIRFREPGVSWAVILLEAIFVDVSMYQKIIDFVKMKLAGALGVIIRAGQNNWVDPFWHENWRKAKEAGLPRGSYWFYDSRRDPKEQARLWASLVAGDLGEMEHAADFEERYGGQFAGWRHWYDFLTEFQRLTGLPNDRIAIYTGYYYWLEYGPNPITEAASLAWFGRFPLWLAWYTNDPSVVRIPKPWTTLRHWQKGTPAVGEQFGVQTVEIDMNHANMRRDEFVAKYGGSIVPPPDGGTMEEYKIIVAGLKIRTAPPIGSVLGPDAGKVMSRDDLIHVDAKDAASGWLRIAKWIKAGGGEAYPPAGVQWWCSGLISYVQFVRVISEPTPEPPPAEGVADMPFTITLGGGDSPYVAQTIAGVIKAK